MKHLTYTMDPPDAIALCLNCRRADCPGQCDALAEARRARKSNRKGKAPAVYTVDGETHTVAEWARITGKKMDTLRRRLLRGMTMAEAIVYSPPAEKLYTAHGRAQTIREWAAETGIRVETLKCRMYKYDLTFEQALDRGQARRR